MNKYCHLFSFGLYLVINSEVKTNMDCSSKNLLYVIKCEGCGEDYFGETGNELRKRMTVHRQQIRDPTINMIPLSAHLRTCAKDKENYFTLFPFYKFADNTTEQVIRSFLYIIPYMLFIFALR